MTPLAETHVRAARRWGAGLRKLGRALLTPRPRLTVTEWAERYRYLGREETSTPGQYRSDRTPFLVEPADAIGDPLARDVVLMKASRLGATQALVINPLGYYIHQRPSRVIVALPTIESAEEYSKDKVDPMLTNSPEVAKVVGDLKARDSGNTIRKKRFPGGRVTFVGTNSSQAMRATDADVVFGDEVDAFAESASAEGDPIVLLVKRTTNSNSRKHVWVSSPKLRSTSRIAKLFKNSTRHRFHIRCPHCDELQVLRWEQIRWEKTERDGETVHHYETAHAVCSVSGCVIEERDKDRAVRRGAYVAEQPDHPVRGYWLNALVSLFDGARWAVLADEWIDAQGDAGKLQVFVNTVLGEPWDERTERPDADSLEARREVYLADVPAGVGVLTASIDKQKDRLEVLVKGWGDREESWVIGHHRLYGVTADPNDPVYAEMDRVLLASYRHESGHALRIRAACFDTGDDTQVAYDVVRVRQARGVYGVKGDQARAKQLLKRPSRKNAKGVRLFLVGTYTAKDILFHRLRIAPRDPGQPTPGLMHWPMPDAAGVGGVDREFLRQYGNEARRGKKLPNGQWVSVYEKSGPNEAVDLEVYALAALHILGNAVRAQLGAIAAELMRTPVDHAVAERHRPPANADVAAPVVARLTASPSPARPAVVRAPSTTVRRPGVRYGTISRPVT